ncbi:hypothetical protein NA78x_001370 [Anatilimnocola sp. NA78]|uniref:hypothetical protein n=1 Tax=Anatilimnocola sp. NA78 TaxID=3415683 RepID=UPI003CE44906
MLAVGELFFPQREALGLTARQLTPGLLARVVHAAAETRSFERAAIALDKIAGNQLSAKTIERVAGDVGRELAAQRNGTLDNEAEHRVPEAPPQLAVVQCDGGRIHTRASEQGPGVHEPRWRETKNACLVRMTSQTFADDPHPELPAAFLDPQKVAELAEKEPLSEVVAIAQLAATAAANDQNHRVDYRPQRLLRTCLSSLVCSEEFGPQMEREAQRRQFFAAPKRAFLGDGQAWNWTLQQTHFADFVPILDFIHALGYLYPAALAVHGDPAEVWSCYLRLATACWQGRTLEVIAALKAWLREQGIEDDELEGSDPRQAVIDAARYLTNNLSRMNYPAYRRAGLPVTSALMESLVKEVNYRVKGSEMFWNDPAGAEAILQIRAAALSEDDRLTHYLATRPGSPFTRTTNLETAA